MKKIPNQVKDKLKPIIQKLLNKCTNVKVKVLNRSAEWEEVAEILEILSSIQELEKQYKFSFPNRKQHLEEFYDWCLKNGAEFSAVKVSEVSEGSFGLFAKRDIKEEEPFLTIPQKIMITETSAQNSKLEPLIKKDPILTNMTNVQVSMHLLMECLDSESFWKPYINTLPCTYSTILYYSLEELKELQVSPALYDVFTIIKSVARQYCYFFQLFQNDSYAKSLNIGNYFTYDLYRWAVSTVMTRQNFLPSTNGGNPITSLVPLFDMCNHTNGKLSTDYNVESDALLSYSFKPFQEGQEVCMFYGPRTNAEFFVHNGFVYPENDTDLLEVKLGISKSDPLNSLKTDVCNKLNIPINGPFYIHKDILLNDELLAFLEIIVMKSDELEKALACEEDCIEAFFHDSSDIKKRAISYLKDRVFLLLKSYKTTLEEDEEIMKQNTPESIHQRSILQLRMCEKRILSSAYDFCEKQLI